MAKGKLYIIELMREQTAFITVKARNREEAEFRALKQCQECPDTIQLDKEQFFSSDSDHQPKEATKSGRVWRSIPEMEFRESSNP